MNTVLFRCSCGYRLIVDEGATFVLHLGHWRINKTTGRVTARCPRCPKEHEIQRGNGQGLPREAVQAVVASMCTVTVT